MGAGANSDTRKSGIAETGECGRIWVLAVRGQMVAIDE